MRWLGTILLHIMGWRVTHPMPQGIKKAVIIMAPHTSNWDFVMGRLGFASQSINAKFIIKKESFFFPLGIILRWLGAVPVDRGFSTGTIKKITHLMEKSDSFLLLITPEGTRKLVRNWKKGFYFIAQQAHVPIVMGFLDYKTKTGGLGPVLYPSGNYEADLKIIEEFYKDKQARHPENFNLSPQYLGSRKPTDKDLQITHQG
jgi:1-acyl-sn-glycerol-3-phosphate acyltransferase